MFHHLVGHVRSDSGTVVGRVVPVASSPVLRREIRRAWRTTSSIMKEEMYSVIDPKYVEIVRRFHPHISMAGACCSSLQGLQTMPWPRHVLRFAKLAGHVIIGVGVISQSRQLGNPTVTYSHYLYLSTMDAHSMARHGNVLRD